MKRSEEEKGRKGGRRVDKEEERGDRILSLEVRWPEAPRLDY